VEIYNNTQEIFDLKDLFITSADDADSLTSVTQVSVESYLLFPEQYMVITEDANWVKQNYVEENPSWFVEVSNLPGYNDDEGRVVLVNALGERIDELHYNASWQFPLISNVETVSLERINPNAATQDSLNWHSAASTVGYGTPTYRNSQYTEPNVTDEITIAPEAFSPDEDGHDDVLSIGFQFDQPGYTANVRLFDSEGRQVRDLVRNALLSQSGVFTWDGITDQNEKARIGIYIVFVEVFNLNGNVKRYKKTCVVAGKPN
jgi:hypothetical protein